MQRPAYIASDIHLGAVPDSTERAFVRFLEHVGCEASSLLLPGDVFDFWFEYGSIIHGAHFRTLAALAELVDAGIPVTMTGGNHDAWGGRFLRERVGVTLHEGLFRTALADRPALVAHGDGLGTGDLKYRALRAVLRSRFTIAAFRALHPELGLRIAKAVSTTEDKAEGEEERARGRARFLEDWARARLAEDASLTWVVCGHAHVPAVLEIEPARWYLNAGDWIRHFTYITITPAGLPALHTWPRT